MPFDPFFVEAETAGAWVVPSDPVEHGVLQVVHSCGRVEQIMLEPGSAVTLYSVSPMYTEPPSAFAETFVHPFPSLGAPMLPGIDCRSLDDMHRRQASYQHHLWQQQRFAEWRGTLEWIVGCWTSYRNPRHRFADLCSAWLRRARLSIITKTCLQIQAAQQHLRLQRLRRRLARWLLRARTNLARVHQLVARRKRIVLAQWKTLAQASRARRLDHKAKKQAKKMAMKEARQHARAIQVRVVRIWQDTARVRQQRRRQAYGRVHSYVSRLRTRLAEQRTRALKHEERMALLCQCVLRRVARRRARRYWIHVAALRECLVNLHSCLVGLQRMFRAHWTRDLPKDLRRWLWGNNTNDDDPTIVNLLVCEFFANLSVHEALPVDMQRRLHDQVKLAWRDLGQIRWPSPALMPVAHDVLARVLVTIPHCWYQLQRIYSCYLHKIQADVVSKGVVSLPQVVHRWLNQDRNIPTERQLYIIMQRVLSGPEYNYAVMIHAHLEERWDVCSSESCLELCEKLKAELAQFLPAQVVVRTHPRAHTDVYNAMCVDGITERVAALDNKDDEAKPKSHDNGNVKPDRKTELKEALQMRLRCKKELRCRK